MQKPRIITLAPKILIGLSMEMSYASNLTGQLWGQFMPRRNEVENTVSDDKFSLQIFKEGFDWYAMDANLKFVKWAAVEVTKDQNIPNGMKVLNLTGGTYAVFEHQGLPSDFPITLQYILNEWMPTSGFEPDYSRPQFELLGKKYLNNHPDSEEEIWFPITKANL